MPIYSESIIGQQPGPHLLILGGVHGDEFEPIAAIQQLQSRINPQLLAGKITLVPIVNRPAFHESRRTGPDELDLARTFPGKPDGSITEQIAYEVATLIRSANYLIDLHTGGLAMRISPLAGYTLHNDNEIRAVQKQMAIAFNLPIVWGTTPHLEGRSLSVARDANVPAIYAEWGGGADCSSSGIQDYIDGCLNVLQSLDMYRHPVPPSRVRYSVEDFRSQSGVLQRNCPAPIAGLFRSALNPGSRIEVGEMIGVIDPVDGQPPLEIRATQSGILLLIRAIPSVKPGDCLATILEATHAGEFRYE